MADTKKTIEILFNGRDNVSGMLKDIGGNLDGIGGSIQSATQPFSDLTKGVIAADAALAALAVGGLALAYSKAVDFDSAMVGLKKVLGDVSQGELDNISEQILKLSDDYGVASTAVTESITGWKQAGFDTAEALGLVKNALDLKIAGDLSAAESTEALTAILKGFRFEASEAARAVDVINEVSNKYATDSKQLSIALGDLSPIAKTMGFTLEESAGLVTPIIEVFRSGSEAANALKTGLLKLVDDAEPVESALRQLGVSQQDANGAMRSGKDIFFDVAAAFKNLDENQKLVIASQIVGVEQAARMVTVFDQLGKVNKVTADAMNASGSAAEEVAVRMKSSQVVIDKFRESFNNMAIEIGNNFRPAIDGIISGMTDVERAIAEASKSGAFDELYEAFDEFGAGAEELLRKVAQALPEALADVDFSVLTQALSDLGGSAEGLFDAFFAGVDLTTPEGLTEAIQKIVDAIAGMQDVVGGILDSFEPFIGLVGDAVDYFGDLDPAMQSTVGLFLGLATQAGLAGGALSLAGGAVSGFGNLLGTLTTTTGKGIDAVKLLSGALGPTGLVFAAGAAGVAIGTLINQLPGVQDTVQGVIGEIDNFLGGVFSAGPTVDEIEKIDNAFFAATQQARRALEETKNLGDGVDSIPEDKKIDVATTAEEARDKLARLGDDVESLTVEEFELAIGVDGKQANDEIAFLDAKLASLTEEKNRLLVLQANGEDVAVEIDKIDKQLREAAGKRYPIAISADKKALKETEAEFKELFVTLEDGSKISIQVPVDKKSKEEAKKSLEELVPPDKRLELQIELDMARIEADADMFKARMDALQTSVEWEAKMEIAQVEAATAQMEAAFASINNTISSTGDVLSSIFGLLGEDLDLQSRWAVFDQIERENDLRERAVEMQERLIEAQISALATWEARLDSDQPIALNISTDNLAPHLEMIWTEVIEALQDQAVLEGGDMLVGMLPTASAT